MMKDIAIVVALVDGAERETVARRLQDRLNPLGRRHVTVVTAPVGGVAFWDQLCGPLQAWGADHIVGDEAYVCLDHEPGLREWTSSATTQFQFMVRVSSAAERSEYEGQPLVNTLEAEDMTTLVNMVMAVTPALDPDDSLSGAFIGVEPMVGPGPDDEAPALVALDDTEGTTELELDPPPWETEGRNDGVVVDDEAEDLEALDDPMALTPDEEAEWDASPTPSTVLPTVEPAAMAAPDRKIDAAPDGVDMEPDQLRPVTSLHAEDAPEFDVTPAPSVARPIPALTPAPDADLLDREPDADVDDETGEADEEGWYPADEGSGDEANAAEAPVAQVGAAAPELMVAPATPPHLEAPVEEQQPTGSDPEFFGEYEGSLPSAPLPAVVAAASPNAGTPLQVAMAGPDHVAGESADDLGQAGVPAESVTPHPWVMYAQGLAAERRQSAPGDSKAAPAAPQPALQLPSYPGPEAFPAPIADVWNDAPEQDQVPLSAVQDTAPVNDVAPAPSPVIPDPSPVEAPANDPVAPPDEERFTLDLDAPADPWGYLGDPEPVAPAPMFAPPVQRGPARAPSAPSRAPSRAPSASSRARAIPAAKSDAGPGLVGTLLSRLRSQGTGGNAKGKGHSFGLSRRVAVPKAPKRQYTDEELAGFLDSGLGGIVAVGALKGGVGKTAKSNVIADIAGKMLSTNNASAAWVDGNLNNPDAGGFFRDELKHSQVSVQTVVAALTNGDVIPEPLKATAESVALYPEAKGVEEYSKTELDQFQQYLRSQHRLSVVDLANVLPAWGSGPAASAALFWVGFADVIVVPTDLNPTSSLPDACDYIRTIVERFGAPDSVGGKPIFVPYIVPAGRAVISDASVQEALKELGDLGATLYPVPYKAMVMLAGAHHQSLDSLDKELSLSYRALTEAVIVAFADARERAER